MSKIIDDIKVPETTTSKFNMGDAVSVAGRVVKFVGLVSGAVHLVCGEHEELMTDLKSIGIGAGLDMAGTYFSKRCNGAVHKTASDAAWETLARI